MNPAKHKHETINKSWCLCVYFVNILFVFVFRDETLVSTELASKLEPAFLSGLRCIQPQIRSRFMEVRHCYSVSMTVTQHVSSDTSVVHCKDSTIVCNRVMYNWMNERLKGKWEHVTTILFFTAVTSWRCHVWIWWHVQSLCDRFLIRQWRRSCTIDCFISSVLR